MLSAENICFAYGKKDLLTDISLTIVPEKLTMLIGSNGTGKSTLFKILAGSLNPYKGQVLLNAKPYSYWGVKHCAQIRAVLSQSSNFLFSFTVLEVVLMGCSQYPNSIDIQKIAHEVLEKVDAIHLINRIFATLSGGEQQRIQIARVLAQIWHPLSDIPRYLLLDEPINNLDLCHQYSILDLLKTLTYKNIGILAIIHDLNLVARYADDVIALSQGKTFAQGKTMQVLTPDLIEKVFNIKTDIITIQQNPIIFVI